MNKGYDEKQYWLDKYAPFFKKENRIIISRESNDMTKTAVLKAEYLRDYKRDGSVLILIDDDPRNLKEVHKLNEDIIQINKLAWEGKSDKEFMFKLVSKYKPTGDQPEAIEYLSEGIKSGKKFQTLLGVTRKW